MRERIIAWIDARLPADPDYEKALRALRGEVNQHFPVYNGLSNCCNGCDYVWQKGEDESRCPTLTHIASHLGVDL